MCVGQVKLEPRASMKEQIVVTTVNGVAHAVYHFFLYDEVDDVKAAIESAVAEFLPTPEGIDYLKGIGWDTFNLGDAVVALPKDILVKHGICRIEPLTSFLVSVPHDRPLAPKVQKQLKENSP